MKRRTAIKNLSLLTGSILFAQGCSDRLLLELAPQETFQFNGAQSEWIQIMSEAILPKGGRSLTTYDAFPDFIEKMIPFRYRANEIQSFADGYNACTDDIKKLFNSSIKKLRMRRS